jgi:hypothetical protein
MTYRSLEENQCRCIHDGVDVSQTRSLHAVYTHIITYPPSHTELVQNTATAIHLKHHLHTI